ncbi:fimbrial biogenesis chaperone [Acinetobacter baumannii]
MNVKSSLAVMCFAASFACQSAQAAIQAMATRVIYEAPASAATLTIKNNVSKPYMVQTWLEGKTGETKNLPIIVVPPLLKLDPDKESILKFIYSGQGLPTNQESLFWINIQEIPPTAQEKNVLQLAIRSRIKLFYRPKEVKTSLDDAVKQLNWFVDGQQLKATNPSPLHITIGVLKLNAQGKPLDNFVQDMVAPNSTITVLEHIPVTTQTISFTYINDYGGATAVPSVNIHRK